MNILEVLSRLTGIHNYLLMDGMHSCAYIPKNTYRFLNKLMLKSIDKNPKAENSLRFMWTYLYAGHFGLVVNPMKVEMARTHGLTTDSIKRIIIPCPYIQQIYHSYGLEPEYCGRMYLKKIDVKKCSKQWLAMFELKNV